MCEQRYLSTDCKIKHVALKVTSYENVAYLRRYFCSQVVGEGLIYKLFGLETCNAFFFFSPHYDFLSFVKRKSGLWEVLHFISEYMQVNGMKPRVLVPLQL